jgi:hypothetical protein
MFNHMKIYTVHIKPGEADAQEKPIFVREGFNLFAFLFTFFWAFYKRLWFAGFLMLGFFLMLIAIDSEHIMTPDSLAVIQLAFQLVIGFQANDWLRRGMAKRGYILHDIASGTSLLAAEQRYFERYLSATPQ